MSRVPEKENISEVKIFVIHYNTESQYIMVFILNYKIHMDLYIIPS
jgi:hypothetical protein